MDLITLNAAKRYANGKQKSTAAECTAKGDYYFTDGVMKIWNGSAFVTIGTDVAAQWGMVGGDIANQTDLMNLLNGKVAIYQGVENYGKYLIVGADGNLAVGDGSPTFAWHGFKDIVRRGLGSTYYPVGTILPAVNHSVYGNIYFRVERYYQDANSVWRVKLWAQYEVVPSLQFDDAEAFYYANSALPAGTYNFTIATTSGRWTAGTYQFTLTQNLPAKGQLVFSTHSDAITEVKVYAFASRTATTKTEECVITAGNEGTNLGTLNTTLNHIDRVRYGSNNYKQSAVRQFLNSNAAAGSVWAPQTKYDRPPSWLASTAGFMAGLPADFLAVVSPTEVACAYNNVFEIKSDGETSDPTLNTRYTVSDYFYLPSAGEVYGQDNSIDLTTQYPLYVGTPNAAKIKTKYNGTQVNYYWLRSCRPSGAYRICSEHTPYGGALDSINAFSAFALFPACDI